MEGGMDGLSGVDRWRMWGPRAFRKTICVRTEHDYLTEHYYDWLYKTVFKKNKSWPHCLYRSIDVIAVLPWVVGIFILIARAFCWDEIVVVILSFTKDNWVGLIFLPDNRKSFDGWWVLGVRFILVSLCGRYFGCVFHDGPWWFSFLCCNFLDNLVFWQVIGSLGEA